MATKAKKPVMSDATKTILEQDRKINELGATILKLQNALDHADANVAQAIDQLKEMEANADLYRKLVNHLLAAVNILAKGAKNG